MQTTEFIWKNGRIVPWHEATVHVLAHGLHYGSGVFEGIRFYKTAEGTAIFKLAEHVKRFFYSAKQLAMNIPFTESQLFDAIAETVRCNQVESGYIRPLAYYGYGSMKVVPDAQCPVDVIIACWPWGSYLPVAAVDVKTSPFIRIHPKSTIADAKIAGHYVNSLLSGLSIRNTHYHEVLMLDVDGYVAEASAANIFIVKNGTLITPPLGTILDGITRKTVMDIAYKMGIPVVEQKITETDIMQAQEAFFCGTAVEISPIRSLNNHLIGMGEVGPITEKMKKFYQQMVHGELPEYHDALTWVEKEVELA